MEAARNLTGKEQERMNRLRKWIKNMKYRHKLTILLVVTALVPMTVLALYAHSRQSTMVRSSDLEDMQSIIDQTKESIDSQTAVYSSLLNYLTYSPDIEEIIKEKNIDNYTAYEKYTKIADPLLSVPKSYHDAINRIQLLGFKAECNIVLDQRQDDLVGRVLKNISDAGANLCPILSGIMAIGEHLPGVWQHQTVHHPGKSAFPRTVQPDDADAPFGQTYGQRRENFPFAKLR